MNILTFDLEEWHLYDLYAKGGRTYFLPIIERYLDRILDILDENKFKATFYSLGIIAREYPHIIKKIADKGHEIACHSDRHILVPNMTPHAFRQDLRLAIDSLEQVSGQKVLNYRAPSYSMNKSWSWTLEILMEEGIKSDSSIFPTYSQSGLRIVNNKEPFLIEKNGMKMLEMPISYHTFLKKNYIFAGGGYFRFFPYQLIRKWTSESQYNMFYFHIRDFDREQKKVLSKRYFLSYYGIKEAENKFINLLNDFEFVSLNEAISSLNFEKLNVININNG